MLAQTPAQFYVGGHIHQQMLRRHLDALALNPGTVDFVRDAIILGEPIRTPPGPSTP
jgi:predicted phosphodiesterase